MIRKGLRQARISLFSLRRRFDPHHRADRFGRAGQRCPAELILSGIIGQVFALQCSGDADRKGQ
jgi:hypothetical protein